MMKKLTWPLFFVGFLFALDEILSVFLSQRYIGSSRAFAELGSTIMYAFFPSRYEANAFYQSYSANFSWSLMVAIGIVSGSFFSAIRSKKFNLLFLPPMWRESMGHSYLKRFVWVFLAGILMAISIRMAGGCTLSMISWTLLMTPTGWVFMMSLFMGGIITTFFFYKGGHYLVRPWRE
jgi:hypothetical protein